MTKMTRLTALAFVLLVLGLVGCDREETIVGCDDPLTVYDTLFDTSVVYLDPIPTTPQGVFSVTGDAAVTVYFNGIYEEDVDYYVVYRSLSALSGYTALGNVNAVSNPNLDLLVYEYVDNSVVNGVTYYYAIMAVDLAGQESDLSAEDVFDTPRPDGQATLYPNVVAPGLAGFNLATATGMSWLAADADIWIDRETIGDDTISYINIGNDQTDIQDMGYTEDFDEITYAPVDGWSRLGYVEVIVDHTYVVWTGDNNYAKIRVNSMTASGAFSFTWGYQTAAGNLELAPPIRPEHDDQYPAPKPGKAVLLLK